MSQGFTLDWLHYTKSLTLGVGKAFSLLKTSLFLKFCMSKEEVIEWMTIGWPKVPSLSSSLIFPKQRNQGSLLVTSFALKLKSKPRDDWFLDHLISQRGVHLSKFGVISPSSVGIRSTSITPYLSNHIYKLSAHIEGLSRLYIPFLVPSLVLIKDDTLRKACIGATSQIQQLVFLPLNLKWPLQIGS